MFQKLIFKLKPLQNSVKFFARSFAKPKPLPVQQQKAVFFQKLINLVNFYSGIRRG